MKVKIKRNHPNAVIPAYAKPGDAGMDLTAVSVKYNEAFGYIEYDTGLQFEIPEGYVGLLFPRSSLSKTELTLCNHVGVLDSSYRGNVTFRFRPSLDYWEVSNNHIADFQNALEKGEFHYFENAEYEYREIFLISNVYAVGDRIGQLIIIPYPQIEFEEVDELSDTERGDGGYGSTGN